MNNGQALAREQQATLKKKVMKHYSKGTMACAKCGFNDLRALSIDHINGGGVSHIREIRGNFYSWLLRNKYPSGFQVLCMNCQWIKRAENGETVKSRRITPATRVKYEFNRMVKEVARNQGLSVADWRENAVREKLLSSLSGPSLGG